MAILAVHDVYKTYDVDPPVRALMGINFELLAGERVVVLGKSGSGKSTFLNIIGLLDEATSGRVEFLGYDTGGLSRRKLDQLRADALGFVFQENHVLGHRTVIENLHVKLGVSSVPAVQWPEMIAQVLEQVGLSHRKHSYARLLSGGEKQRLAVARAIITSPKVLLADEPTGNLDDENADRILDLFDEQARRGSAIVIITHDPRLVHRMDKAFRLVDGRLVAVTDQELVPLP